MANTEDQEMTFWDHLDVLRGTIFRSAFGVLVGSIIVFCFKDFFFNQIIFAPTKGEFLPYRLMGVDFTMELINIDISAQFFVHLKLSLALGFIFSFPYICYQVWKFIAPALYPNEKKAVSKAFAFSSFFFYFGIAVGYMMVLPITLNFFLSYSISDMIHNTISLNSYISMFVSMVLLFGIVSEFPVLIAVLSHMGLLTKTTLRKYRKHAIVAIFILAAIITPADPFSMFVAAAPLYLLYECSIWFCKSENYTESIGD